MKPRFYHIRNYVNGKLMGKGGETFYVVPYSTVGKHILIDVSHARCSPIDNFSRKIGRKICLNRMSMAMCESLTMDDFLKGISYNRYKRFNLKLREYKKSVRHAQKKFLGTN